MRRLIDAQPGSSSLSLSRCQPIYAEFPGWRTPTHNARKWKDLPAKTRSYLKALAELTDAMMRSGESSSVSVPVRGRREAADVRQRPKARGVA